MQNFLHPPYYGEESDGKHMDKEMETCDPLKVCKGHIGFRVNRVYRV